MYDFEVGETYRTRDGELVKITRINSKNPVYPISGVEKVNQIGYIFTSTGKYVSGTIIPHPKDLIRRYEKQKKPLKVLKFRTITTKDGTIPYNKEATTHSVTYDELQEVYNIIYSTKETIWQ